MSSPKLLLLGRGGVTETEKSPEPSEAGLEARVQMSLLPGSAGQRGASCSSTWSLFMCFAMAETFTQGCGGRDSLVFRGGSRVSSTEGYPPGLNVTLEGTLSIFWTSPSQPLPSCTVSLVGVAVFS